MRALKRLWWTAPAAFGLLGGLSACGQNPQATENARGVLEGVPLVLALSVLFIVGAIGLIGGAVVLDRMMRSRAALTDELTEPDESDGPDGEEEADEVVAGITVGRAAPPRWLYGAYVLIPIFAMAYVFSNVAVAPAKPAETEAPAPAGPCTDCAITASGIRFTTEKLEVAAESEVTVTFSNEDAGVPHDFTVFEAEADSPGGEKLANTATFSGAAEREVSFESPAAGTSWFFVCTVHPAMNGELEAVASEG